jgi:hypothetical protein
MALLRIDLLMGPDLTSKPIAWFGNGPDGYSHCASVLADGRYLDARSDTLGGVPPGIHIRDPATEAWVRKRRCTLSVDQATYDAWEANLRAKISDKYAKGDIIGFLVDRMLHRVGTYDCSALVVDALQHVKRVPFPLWLPAHRITPNVALTIVQMAGFTIGPEIRNG